MNVLLTLMKREYWENKGSLLILPLAVAGFLMVSMLFVMIAIESGGESLEIHINADSAYFGEDDIEGDGIEGNKQEKEITVGRLGGLAFYPEHRKAEIVQYVLNTLAKPLVLVLWGVIFFYLLASLYEDRKDRSVLFWKSMPVSDAMTVISKLLIAVLMAPLIVILCIMVIQLVVLLAASILTLGQDISQWDTFWRPSNLLVSWINLFARAGFIAFWCLPFFGWLMLVSSFARSIPLAWALGIPIAILVVETISFSGGWISAWMSRHVFKLDHLVVQSEDLGALTGRLFSLDMISALVIGGAMIAAAIWMRGRCEEI